MATNQTNQLKAIESVDGYSVQDPAGGRWWPRDEAAAEIAASADPAAAAVRICTTQPMRGAWHS